MQSQDGQGLCGTFAPGDSCYHASATATSPAVLFMHMRLSRRSHSLTRLKEPVDGTALAIGAVQLPLMGITQVNWFIMTCFIIHYGLCPYICFYITTLRYLSQQLLVMQLVKTGIRISLFSPPKEYDGLCD